MKTLIKDLFYSVVPKSDYLEYHLGNTNLILSAPHGGAIKPFNIKNRTWGSLLRDTYTRRITKEVVSILGTDPYYVISDIHRVKVDLNRDIGEAAQGDKKAEQIWKQWEDIMSVYTGDIIDRFGKGLYIDIHSHGLGDEFQIGYNLGEYDYARVIRGEKVTGSSVDSLGRGLYDMMEGTRSIRATLNLHGYKVFHPSGNRKYFNGGRNIEVFSGMGMGAIQIEVPVSVASRGWYGVAVAISSAIQEFKNAFVGGN